MFELKLLLYLFLIVPSTNPLECQERSTHGSDFTGNINITQSSKLCEKWPAKEEKFMSVGEDNYCRNPTTPQGSGATLTILRGSSALSLSVLVKT